VVTCGEATTLMAAPLLALGSLGLDFAPAPIVRSGASKRQSKRQLPLDVFVYSYNAGGRPTVHGAMRVHSANRLPRQLSADEHDQLRSLGCLHRDDVCVLGVDRPAALPEPVPLPENFNLAKTWGAPRAWRLPLLFQLQLRRSLALVDASAVYALRAPSSSFAKILVSGDRYSWLVMNSFCNQAGILCAKADDVNDAESDPEPQNRPPSPPPSGSRTPVVELSIGKGKWLLSTVRMRLYRGFVKHLYEPKLIFLCLRLSVMLRSDTVKLCDAVGLAAQVILPMADGKLVDATLHDGLRAPLPGREILRLGRVKMDMALMLYQRVLTAERCHARFLYGDSSPQFQWNFYALREDRIRLPTDPASPLRVTSISAAFEMRVLPVTVIGYGHGGLAKKAYNTWHSQSLECTPLFDKVRLEVRGWTSDQGTERAIADAPYCEGDLSAVLERVQAGEINLNDGEGCEAFMYPLCLYMPAFGTDQHHSFQC
jgi:hypothetical protein